jgi:hypothetical protein
MTDRYEWHQVEREDLNEGWIWIRQRGGELKDVIHRRRPVLLLKHGGKSVCCETLYADDGWLARRRYSIMIGQITKFSPPKYLEIAGRFPDNRRRKEVVKNADINIDPEMQLTEGLRVCVFWTDPTYGDKKPPVITLEKNLIFLSAWYRHHLGISDSRPFEIDLDIKQTNSRLRQIWWQLRACARHPQIAVVMSTVLAFIGTGLGIVGVAAVLKEFVLIEFFEQPWPALALIGLVICGLGFAPLFKRARI